MPAAPLPDVISTEHKDLLTAIAAELVRADLPTARHLELLAACEQIADHYCCDPRLCE